VSRKKVFFEKNIFLDKKPDFPRILRHFLPGFCPLKRDPEVARNSIFL